MSISIRLHADGFSFFVCDLQTSNLIRGEHFRLAEDVSLVEQLGQELSRPDYFNRQIDQCFVLVCAPTTHVPLEEFRRDEATALYGYTFSDFDVTSQRVAYNILPHLELVELYALPTDVEEVILQFYPTARFFAARAILMERLLLLEEDQSSEHPRLYLCPEEGAYSLYAFRQQHLLFANTFAVSNQSDALYFILNVWKQLDFDHLHDSLCIVAPQESRDTELCAALAEYIVHVENAKAEDIFSHVPLASEKQVPLDLKALLLNRI
ncbi:MAG: DUF3822 family protein [Bacteroidaceae bacterium]|nr:DUF3822 family protein [Bacteroidaceae bacterium]